MTPLCHHANMSSTLGFGTDDGGDGSVLDAIVKLLVCDPAQCGREGFESSQPRTRSADGIHGRSSTRRSTRTPTTGRRQQRCRSDRASEVAAELEHALTSVLSRSPP
jgi:hypothetical protein